MSAYLEPSQTTMMDKSTKKLIINVRLGSKYTSGFCKSFGNLAPCAPVGGKNSLVLLEEQLKSLAKLPAKSMVKIIFSAFLNSEFCDRYSSKI